MVDIKGGYRMDTALAAYAVKINKGKQVSIGFQNGATEADGTPVALIAAFNEYGVPSHNQPPRSFFRDAIAKNDKKWATMFGKGMTNTQGNADRVLELMGIQIAADIRQSILNFTSPPLAEATIKKKGFDKPLIDTHTMLDNVTYVVKT